MSVIDDCNFRCTYCMPREVFGESYKFLSETERLSYDEIVRLAGIFASVGTRKIKLSGGEPLLRPWIDVLIERLVGLSGIEDVGLITNGFLLEGLAPRLKRAGLHRVTVSIDSLDDRTWGRINGRGYRVERIMRGIQAALDSGFSPIKINAVVQRGVNDHEIMNLVEHFKGQQFQLRFIEYMDVGTLNDWSPEQVVPSREILSTIEAVHPLVPIEPAYRGEVARRYRYLDGDGEIGFISSITEPFCGDCSRARLSADGKLVTCLFSKEGTDLRDPLRSGATDDEIRNVITNRWSSRDDRYSEVRTSSAARDRIEMFKIGG